MAEPRPRRGEQGSPPCAPLPRGDAPTYFYLGGVDGWWRNDECFALRRFRSLDVWQVLRWTPESLMTVFSLLCLFVFN